MGEANGAGARALHYYRVLLGGTAIDSFYWSLWRSRDPNLFFSPFFYGRAGNYTDPSTHTVCTFHSPPAGACVNKSFFFSLPWRRIGRRGEGETSIEMRKHNLHIPYSYWRTDSSWPEEHRFPANVWHFYVHLVFLPSETFALYTLRHWSRPAEEKITLTVATFSLIQMTP